MMWLPEGEKVYANLYSPRFIHMFSHFDIIPACDRQTDRRTSCDSIVHRMHTHRAAKNQVRTTKIFNCRELLCSLDLEICKCNSYSNNSYSNLCTEC